MGAKLKVILMSKDFYDFDELLDDELDKDIVEHDEDDETIVEEPKITTRDDVPQYLKEVVSR